MVTATGVVIAEAQFNRNFITWKMLSNSVALLFSFFGIPLIPFWLLFSLWYLPEYRRRWSVTLTANALEIKTGVFFRQESIIPLNRITDLRMHHGPLMRIYGLRGMKVETAGSAGTGNPNTELDIIAVADPEIFRNTVMAQRQRSMQAGPGQTQAGLGQTPAVAAAPAPGSNTLVEIRDILARIESHLARRP